MPSGSPLTTRRHVEPGSRLEIKLEVAIRGAYDINAEMCYLGRPLVERGSDSLSF